jgi:hypothetical protein
MMDGDIDQLSSLGSTDDVRGCYEARLKNLSEATSQLTSRYRFLINVELGLLLLLATVFYVLYTHHLIDPLFGTVMYTAAGFLVISIPARLLVRTSSKLQAKRKITAYYETRMQRLDGTWPGSGDDGSDFSVADHPYCSDLDVIGRGSLFEYLCSAQTGAGRQWLADALLSPASPADVVARQRAIGELRDRNDLREYFASTGASGTCSFQGKSLKEWSKEVPISFPAFVRISGACLCIINVVIIALALSGRLSPEAPLGTLAIVGLFTAALHRKVAQVLERADSILVYELELLIAYSRRLRQEHFECTLLRETTNSLCLLSNSRLQKLLRIIRLMKWHQDPAFTYLSNLSLWGALFAMRVEKIRINFANDLAMMAAAIGELEGLSSLAAYAYEHSDYPFPSFVASEDAPAVMFRAESLGHPLIESATCVRNPVRIDENNRFVLVSGSNMSGKSTYLRAIGLNYVLARAGAPVCATSLYLSVFSVATSMRVLDSLPDGKSRFLAEVSLVKQVMDLAEQEPVLFLFDELFSGTNSEDRRAGAAGTIAHLLQKNASGFLTTHDLALSDLVLSRSMIAKNVHFIDQVAEAGMTFDYRLRDGLAPHTNGAVILARLGIL